MDSRRSIRVYLDQNILSDISGVFPNPDTLDFKLVPVYSHAHLEELANWKDEAPRSRVCTWLADNESELLQLVKTGDDPNSSFNKFFEFMKPNLTTGKVETRGSDVVSFFRVDPIQSVQSIVLQRANKRPMNMLQVIGLKLAGGFQNQTIEELVSPYIEEIKKTNEVSKRKLEEYSAIDPLEAEKVKAFLRDISVPDAEADRVEETLVTTFEDAIRKLKMTSGMQDYRQALGLDPKILNNLELPNVFRKIYDLACQSPNMPPNKSYDDFWGLGKDGFQNPGSLHGRVVMLHAHLNWIGYWADEKLQKEGQFMGASRDGWHLANSIFCDFFITRDKKLFKKAEAIFEFLKIQTQLGYSNGTDIQLSNTVKQGSRQ